MGPFKKLLWVNDLKLILFKMFADSSFALPPRLTWLKPLEDDYGLVHNARAINPEELHGWRDPRRRRRALLCNTKMQPSIFFLQTKWAFLWTFTTQFFTFFSVRYLSAFFIRNLVFTNAFFGTTQVLLLGIDVIVRNECYFGRKYNVRQLRKDEYWKYNSQLAACYHDFAYFQHNLRKYYYKTVTLDS